MCVVRVKVGYLSEFLSTSCVTKLTFLGQLPSEFMCSNKLKLVPSNLMALAAAKPLTVFVTNFLKILKCLNIF